MSLSQRELMLSNQPYLANDPNLVQERLQARILMKQYNESSPENEYNRKQILDKLLGSCGTNVKIEPPFYCDYGWNIHLGPSAYLNFNCVLLDCNRIEIGQNTMFGPNVQVYTAYHPVDPEERAKGPEMAAPIRIGENVWVGGGAILCPGIEIGDNTTIGAGSVVTRSIPDHVVAAGNPCKIIRKLQ